MWSKRADGRSILVILLAFAPILGVLAVAVVWIDGANARTVELDREIESVRLASTQEANRNTLASAVHVFQIAALADAPASVVEAAEATKERLAFRDSQVDQMDALVGQVGGAVAAEADADAFRQAVVGAVGAHRVGGPVSDTLIGIEEAVTIGLMSGSINTLFLTLGDLAESTALLRALIAFEVEFDADLREVLSAAQVGETVPTETLVTPRPVRSLQWDADAGTWNFGSVVFDGDTPARVDAGSMTDGPVTAAFLSLEQSSTSNERRAALVELLAVDRQISGAVEAAANAVEQQYTNERNTLAAERWVNIALFALMFAVGLALLVMSRLELQRRRVVESAHRNALTSMADKAYRDQLTGLRNRRWLDEALAQFMSGLQETSSVSLVYLDLDGFKAVNDVWGHDSGDDVLRNVGACLQRWSAHNPNWEFARFGGDEFVGFVPGEVEPQSGTITRLLASISDIETPNPRGHAQLRVRASAGVATGTSSMGASELILRADSALSQAKDSGRGSVRFYDGAVSRTSELLPLMPAALDGDEFQVHLQPIVDLRLGKIAHVEALARWFRPEGLVGPGDFVPLAETYGLADRLTEAIVRDVSRVRQAKPLLPRVWVNVSPVELTLHDFAGRFLGHLQTGGLDPNLVGIEVTESAAIQNVEEVALVLGTIRDAGVLIAIDDFGSGYTPLGHLRTLPIDVIKIDRALIAHIDEDFVNQEIVRGIFNTARRLDCDVVAEGVERIEELSWVDSIGIRYVQGFLLGRPAAPAELPLSLPSALLGTS